MKKTILKSWFASTGEETAAQRERESVCVTCPRLANDLKANTKLLMPALGSGSSTLTSPEGEFHCKTAFIHILC